MKTIQEKTKLNSNTWRNHDNKCANQKKKTGCIANKHEKKWNTKLPMQFKDALFAHLKTSLNWQEIVEHKYVFT